MTHRLTIHLPIKPMSVNEAWKGRRFKSDAYKAYEKEVGYRLPAGELPEPPYRVEYEFGLSSILSDLDNPVKPLQDIIAKKYGFNDKLIMQAVIKKVKVEKGSEYFRFTLSNLSITEV